ncbi:hypothetical protein [Sphingobacterium sp. 1.A.4]|uniref:hypothetical protein n=1 Tax=Sphingobacterium sp. 1.A.4 TaxID=2044603 RepID=UPI00211DC899|nr:hypothetical protein [Sphingobacterium sp. 1.A.4]
MENLFNQQFKGEGLPTETFDIRELLGYCTKILEIKAMAKGQRIILKADHIIFIPAQNEQLWRVFSNLITNAIKFAPHGAQMEVTAIKQVSKVLVSVRIVGQESLHKYQGRSLICTTSVTPVLTGRNPSEWAWLSADG